MPSRLRGLAALPLLLAACTETNLVTPPEGTGGIILFASDREDRNFEIFRIAGDGRGLRRLTTDPEHNDFAPVQSPDGRQVAWQREIPVNGGVSAMEIWVMAADGSDKRVVVSNGSFNESPSWTSDSRSIVYSSFVTGNWEIFRVGLDGQAPVNLTRTPFADRGPRVSPDGTRIVFHTNRDLNYEIYEMRLDGSAPRNLTNHQADDRFAAWTPDGRQLVWSRFIESFDLYAMSADGDDSRPLLATEYQESHPSVSPDGRQVVFTTNRVPPLSLFVMPLAGGEALPLTGNDLGSDQEPSWSAGAP